MHALTLCDLYMLVRKSFRALVNASVTPAQGLHACQRTLSGPQPDRSVGAQMGA